MVLGFVKPIGRRSNACKPMRLVDGQNILQCKQTTDEGMLKFFGITIEMGLVQMPKVSYYWSSSQLYESEIIRSTMSREKFELLLKFWHFANNDEKHPSQDTLFKLHQHTFLAHSLLSTKQWYRDEVGFRSSNIFLEKRTDMA